MAPEAQAPVKDEKPKGGESELATAFNRLVDSIRPTEPGGVIQRSRQPLVRDYPYNPKNYDVRKEADTIAKSFGHDLSVWVVAPAAEGQKVDHEFYIAKCLECGGNAHARWRGKPNNDRTTGTGQFPELGGECLVLTCQELKRRNGQKNGSMFSRRQGE